MLADLLLRAVSGLDPGLDDTLVAAQLPADDLADGGRLLFRFDAAGKVVGYGGFDPRGEHALIRSIVVLPEARGTGAGRRIVEAMMAEASKLSARDAFLLTTTAAEFFQHLGLEVIDRGDAPATILNTRQATTICYSATLLSRRADG